MNFTNTGNETLVGEGQHSTLIKDSLLFEFPSDTEILNSELSNRDLPLQIEQRQPNQIALKFSQWKPSEKAVISLYITSQNMQQNPLLPQITTRDIVDGNVLVRNALNPVARPRTLGECLPSWVTIIVKVILSLFCCLFIFLGFYILPKDLFTFIRYSTWQRKNSAKFKQFIESQSDILDSQKELYISHPAFLPEETWKGFTGDKLKTKDTSGFSSYSEAITITLGGILVAAVSLVYVVSNVFDAYLMASEYLKAA